MEGAHAAGESEGLQVPRLTAHLCQQPSDEGRGPVHRQGADGAFHDPDDGAVCAFGTGA